MYKETIVEFDNDKNFYSIILGDTSLTKLASNQSQEISDFIAKHNFDTSKYLYVLINALGADEYYGPNKNGDGFPEYYEGEPNLIHDGKDYGYKTFELFAKFYKHHVNKDPEKSYGDVLLSVYNPRMHRVELIVKMDRGKAPLECSRVENGEVLSTSMGTKVPFDVCSICGNKAKTRQEYCYHLKNMMGKILPDGRKVYAVNPRPKFFDISMVFIPADPTSRVIQKIASSKEAQKEVIAVEKKEADIEKEVPAEGIESTSIDDIIEHLIDNKFKKLEDHEIGIPNERLNALCRFPLEKILSTMAFSGIMPKPREFQRIILIKLNKPNLADLLEKQNVVFNQDSFDSDPDIRLKIHVNSIEPEVFDDIEDLIPCRSRWQPHLLSRLIDNNKLASVEYEQTADNIMPIMLAVSGLYSLFKKAVPEVVMTALATLLGRHPVLAAGIAATGTAASVAGELIRPHTYALGTTRAEDLLKLGNFNDYLEKLLYKKTNNIKKVAGIQSEGLKYILKNVFKNVGGFMPKGSFSVSDAIRRGIVSLPILSLASGMSQTKKLRGHSTTAPEDFLAKHPGKVLVLAALAGHRPIQMLMGKKASMIDPVVNPDDDSIKLLYEDGNMLDLVTLVKLGSIF